MPQIEVRRLQYRGEVTQAERVELAVNDALRTETTDDGRLILVRILRLGRIGIGERGASHATATAWRELIGSARHGGSSGAESANCVWFASLAEARVLLLRELARGRTPFAWFWALAVPDWRRMTLAQYLERRLALALAEPSGKAVAALVDEAVAANATEALAAAILALMPTSVGATRAPVERFQPETVAARPAPSTATFVDIATEAYREVALGILHAVPTPLRTVLEGLATHGAPSALIEMLAGGLVRRFHPALALAPRSAAFIAFVIIQVLRSGDGRSTRAPRVLPESGHPTDYPLAGKIHRQTPPRDRPPEGSLGEQREDPAPGRTSGGLTPPAEPAELPAQEPYELASAAAGVFLTIVPLLRLGWREWLGAHPDLLLHQPGARLLHLIASHHRAPLTDAVWGVLPEFDQTAAPDEVTEALAMWRAGLDRWLRRKTRIRLTDVVLRRGWLLPGPETTIVRFPLNGIDIRLRRRALDGDPGWVDWLGHSYRLVYRDQPLTGPQLR